MAVLVGALLIFAVVASATGNGPMMRSPLTFVIFAAYALLQIVCIALYDFGLNIRKTGFYFLHIGMLVMLVGFLAYIISGEYYNLNFSVGENYNGFYTSEGRYVDFGFGISVNDFTVEKPTSIDISVTDFELPLSISADFLTRSALRYSVKVIPVDVLNKRQK